MTNPASKSVTYPALKPCPFCGGIAEIVTSTGGQAVNFDTIYKAQCSLGACAESPWEDLEREAVNWWNRRAPETRAMPAPDLTCRRCYGSGTIEVPDEVGPNAHPMDVDCPVCKGTGAEQPPTTSAQWDDDKLIEWLVKRSGYSEGEAFAIVTRMPPPSQTTPAAQNAVQRAEYWKTEHNAANAVIDQLRAFIERVAEQKPEKPDYWSSCGQCEHNISDAEDLLPLLKSPPTTRGELAGGDVGCERHEVTNCDTCHAEKTGGEL